MPATYPLRLPGNAANVESDGLRLRQRELKQQRALNGGEIVVGNEGEDDVAALAAVNAQAFHIVDLVAKIDVEQNGAVNQRARLDLAERDAAHAHGQTAAPAESPFQQQNVAAGQERGIGDVVARTSPDGEVAGARSPDEEAAGIAGLVEAALRDRDQRTGKR